MSPASSSERNSATSAAPKVAQEMPATTWMFGRCRVASTTARAEGRPGTTLYDVSTSAMSTRLRRIMRLQGGQVGAQRLGGFVVVVVEVCVAVDDHGRYLRV